MQGCIDDKQLLDLAYGSASAELRRAAEEHAETCDRCRELLDSASERITWTGDEPRTSEPASAPLVALENLPALPVTRPKQTAKKPISAGGKLDPKALVEALRTAGYPVRPTRGTAIGRYLVIDRLGESATNAVYSAYDPDEDRKVALRLFNDPAAKSGSSDEPKVVRELRKLKRLTHPLVVPIWDVGIDHGHMYVVTEFIKGWTLSAWLKEVRPSQREILKVLVQAGRGLEAAHTAGLVHGSFRSSAVFVGKDGVTHVADIGIVCVVESRKASPADDQSQFCRVLAEVLDTASADVPERERRAIQRGQLERSEDRFASMTDLLLELDTEPNRWWRVAVAMGLVLLGMALVFALDRYGVLK